MHDGDISWKSADRDAREGFAVSVRIKTIVIRFPAPGRFDLLIGTIEIET